jgi:hypothetical protein
MATPAQSPPAVPKWFDLSLWLDLLQGPKCPPFGPNTAFDGEEKRFWGVLFISAVLTGFSVVLDPAHLAENFSLTPAARYCIAGTAAFAILYCLGFSRLFGIKITIKQAFFVFGFLTIPWIPVFSFVVFFGNHFTKLSPIFVVMAYLFPIYVVWSLARGISIVSGRTTIRAIMSLCLLVGCGVAAAVYNMLQAQ